MLESMKGSTSMTIYLYKKTHNITGLKYLGKTKRDPFKYNGSGEYWISHLKKHGYDLTTEILKECQTNDEIKHWGKYYSDLWNIVEERDSTGKKTWANLKPEEGDGGAGARYMNDPLIKAKHLEKINTTEVKKKHHNAMIESHKTRGNEYKSKISKTLSDPTIYQFYHVTGIIEKCTRIELIKKYILPSGHISNMIHEKHRIVKGWRVI
jgi:hypothetical protein